MICGNNRNSATNEILLLLPAKVVSVHLIRWGRLSAAIERLIFCSLDISRKDVKRPRFVIPPSLIPRAIIVEARRCGSRKGEQPLDIQQESCPVLVHTLRVIVFFQRVLDPVTRFGRE